MSGATNYEKDSANAHHSMEHSRYGPGFAGSGQQVGGYGAAFNSLRGGHGYHRAPGAHGSAPTGFHGAYTGGAGYHGYGVGAGFQSAGYAGAYGAGAYGPGHQGFPGQQVQQVYGGVQSVVQSPELIQARERSEAMWADVNAKGGQAPALRSDPRMTGSSYGPHGTGYGYGHPGFSGQFPGHGDGYGYPGLSGRGGHFYGPPGFHGVALDGAAPEAVQTDE